MRILLVEDDEKLNESLAFQLKKEGFLVDACRDGEEALYYIEENIHDLILLDRMLPLLSGTEVLARMRQARNETPVILITALGTLDDKVTGLDSGADDYLVKPFAFEELMARIRAVLKRAAPPSEPKSDEAYTCGGLTVNPVSYEVTVEGKRLNLTPKEFDLLLYFVRHQGMVLARETLLNEIWGYDFYGDSRTVDTHIKMLRSSLGEGYRDRIKTVWGVGYRYDETE